MQQGAKDAINLSMLVKPDEPQDDPQRDAVSSQLAARAPCCDGATSAHHNAKSVAPTVYRSVEGR